MERHYILQATVRLRDNEFLCPIGIVCEEADFVEKLKHASIVRYKVKQVDGDPVAGWENSDWVPVG